MKGSPAHAGIDPAKACTSWTPARFPRTRGDRPAFFLEHEGSGEVPPHTRG